MKVVLSTPPGRTTERWPPLGLLYLASSVRAGRSDTIRVIDAFCENLSINPWHALPAHRPLPFSFHPSYSLVLGLRYFHAGLARFRRTGAPFVMLYHLIDFAEPLPATRASGWARRLYTLSHLSGERKRERCQRMLEAVQSAYPITDTTTIVNRTVSRARRANG